MKKTVLNFRWIFFVCLFILLTLLGAFSLKEDLWISIAVIAMGIFFVFGYAFFIPNSYTFSHDGIVVRYCFGLKTFLRWSNIKHLEDHHAGGAFPWWREYEIGYFDTKIIFHTEAMIPKNRKTTEIINTYYRKKIEQYG